MYFSHTLHKTNINLAVLPPPTNVQKILRAIYHKVHRKPWKHFELLLPSCTPYISAWTLQFIRLSIHPISLSYLTFCRLFARNAIGKYLAIIPSVIHRIKSFRILLKRTFALFMAYQMIRLWRKNLFKWTTLESAIIGFVHVRQRVRKRKWLGSRTMITWKFWHPESY